jgi:hypothetical protein
MKMSFLKRFFMDVLHEDEHVSSRPSSSFERLSEEELETHLRVAQYGHFRLTDAVRPSYDLQVTPTQGYRHDEYRDETGRTRIPVLMGAASSEILFDLFVELLEPLGSEVDVVLETSHYQRRSGHRDLYREHIDLPVLTSILWDYEDLLLNDGCTGIAVINPATPQELQLDEHKLLIMYGEPLDAFEDILQARGVRHRDTLRFITEGEHVHSSKDEYARQFDELKMRLGMDEDLLD